MFKFGKLVTSFIFLMGLAVASVQAAEDDVVAQAQLQSRADLLEYWTEERMRNATPMPLPKCRAPALRTPAGGAGVSALWCRALKICRAAGPTRSAFRRLGPTSGARVVALTFEPPAGETTHWTAAMMRRDTASAKVCCSVSGTPTALPRTAGANSSCRPEFDRLLGALQA